MKPHLDILVVTSHKDVADQIRRGFPLTTTIITLAESVSEALNLYDRDAITPDLILLDSAPTHTETLKRINAIGQFGPETPLILLVNDQTASCLAETEAAGVNGFLTKPLVATELQQLTSQFCDSTSTPKRNSYAQLSNDEPHVTKFNDGNFFLAASPAMLEILRQIERIALPDVPVLITGESGVGKEMVARMLHLLSRRANRSFLKVNCAALPAELLESELFGYEAGAFTGAVKAKPGKFEQCDRGTILLDEIGEMSAALQAKLLHVLQDGTFSRLGSRTESKVNVRIIAATNIQMEKALADKTFREDLFYRLGAFVIEVPPLRERRVEIPYLLRDMAKNMAITHQVQPIEFSPRLITAALEYHWPGNLRELGNFVRRYLILRDEAMALVDLQHKTASSYTNLRNSVTTAFSYSGGLKAASRCAKDDAETAMLRSVLQEANWNRRVAAEKLQISYKALLYKIRQYQLDAPETFVARQAITSSRSVPQYKVAMT